MTSHVTHNGVEFPIMYCGLCGHTIRCPKCGNNSCNGGSGEIDGKPCDTCDAAYDAMFANEKLLAALDK